MDHVEFMNAAESFQNDVEAIVAVAGRESSDNYVQQAIKALNRAHSINGGTPEQLAIECLGHVKQQIDLLLADYRRMVTSLGFDSRY